MAHLFHACGGLGQEPDDEVFLGNVDDIRAGNLPSPNRISPTMRAKLVLTVPGGSSRSMWFSLVAEVYSRWAASRWSI